MKNKGFSLVELLAVIALLAIISLISVYSISGIRNNVDKNLLQDKIDNIEAAAVYYGEDHRSELNDCTDPNYEYCKLLTVKELLDAEYLTSEAKHGAFINNTTGYSMDCDTVLVFVKNNRIYSEIDTVKSNSEECNTGGE